MGSGGIEAMICNISNGMCRIGYDVSVCSIFAPSSTDIFWYKLDRNVHKITLNKKSKGISIKTLIQIYKLIKSSKYDVVHIHGFLYYYYLPVCFLNRRVKFFYTVHSDAEKENSSWDKKLFKIKKELFYHRWIVPITISDTSKSSFVNLYKFEPELIYNGVPHLYDIRPSYIVEHSRLSKNTKVFVHPGRITQAKNQIVLCKVFAKIINEGYDVVLLIVGDNQDENIFSEIKKYFSTRIRYLGPMDNIPMLLFSADGFCLPSVWEGMPVTLLEALSVGCIPICSPVGGVADVISDGIDGILSTSPSEDDYYNAMIRYLFTSEDNIKKMKSACLETFQKYSIENTVIAYLDLYKR